jgi:hypothetical protein
MHVVTKGRPVVVLNGVLAFVFNRNGTTPAFTWNAEHAMIVTMAHKRRPIPEVRRLITPDQRPVGRDRRTMTNDWRSEGDSWALAFTGPFFLGVCDD